MAIPMPIVQDIRRLDRQGMSRAQIARRLHVDRGTVAKYADMEDCSPKPKADRRYGSKIDPYAHLVDEWLEADRMLPRKQRHTIRRVHDRLLAETDYDGEYSTTMRYVHRWREANRGVPDREGYVRLEWAAGSMQVDFGVARARIAGEMADVHCLVASLPYSNMRLCVALPGENAECLCHGLMLVFEHIGGVPPVIVMDNATGAGRRNAKGEVALTGVFSAFVAHYRLEVRFCNPYSGNEKGSVENAVGFLRRNLMVPPMRAESYGQLSRLLLERCDGLARDSYCPRLLDVPVAEVFDEERAALMPLPSTAFDPVRWESRTADKYGLVDIDSNRYLAGPDSARSRVLAAIRWDTVTLASPATGELFAEYPRQYGRSRNVEDPALVLPRLAVKPRAWRESSIRPDVPDDIRAWPFSTLPSRDWIAPASEDVRSVTLKAPLPPCTSSAVTAMDDAELFHTVPDFQPLRSSSNPPLTTNSTGSSADAAVTPIVAGNTAPMQHSTDAAAAATTRPVFRVCNM